MNRRQFFKSAAAILAAASVLPAIELLPEAPTLTLSQRQEKYVEQLGKFDFIITKWNLVANDNISQKLIVSAQTQLYLRIEATLRIADNDFTAAKSLIEAMKAQRVVTLDWTGQDEKHAFTLDGFKVDYLTVEEAPLIEHVFLESARTYRT